MIKYTILPIVTLAIIAVVLASVFAYYPLTITATPQAPGVVFQAGGNAGQPDIGANKIINVTLGPNSVSATVKIHPTYQETYYKDVLRIYNGDDNAMNIYLIFDSVSNTLPAGSQVMLFVYQGTTKVAELNITNPSTGSPIKLGTTTISAGATWQIDFYVKIPEGTTITGASYTASARLVYTPSTETPPVVPSSGR